MALAAAPYGHKHETKRYALHLALFPLGGHGPSGPTPTRTRTREAIGCVNSISHRANRLQTISKRGETASGCFLDAINTFWDHVQLSWTLLDDLWSSAPRAARRLTVTPKPIFFVFGRLLCGSRFPNRLGLKLSRVKFNEICRLAHSNQPQSTGKAD